VYWKHLLLTVFVMAIWGVNFSAIKLGLNNVDPFLVAAARFFLATFPIIFFIPKPKVPFKFFLLYGLSFGTGVWGMAYCSIAFGLSSGMASVLLQLDVLTSVFIGVLFFKEIISRQMVIGTGITLVGLLVSVIYTNGNVTPAGIAFILVSALCWPIAGLLLRKSGTNAPFAFNIWGMLFAPVPLVLLSLLVNGTSGFSGISEHWTGATWFAVLFQAYPTTLFGYWVWNRMLLIYPMAKLAPLTLLTTLFALLSGYIIYGERLSNVQWVSCTLFLLGILIVLLPSGFVSKRKPALKAEAAEG
jgi:O-acetylserine/cysteine efflux transporter